MKTRDRALYKFEYHTGRSGSLEGIFILSNEDYERSKGLSAWYDDVLGKHSEITLTLGDGTFFTRITDDPEILAVFETFNLATGFNPYEECDIDELIEESENDENE